MSENLRAQTVSRGESVQMDDDARRVLRNTWNLLALTLLFGAGMAWLAMNQGWGHPNIWVFFGVVIGLSFLTNRLKNSAWGLLGVFAFAGFLGAVSGSIVSFYLAAYSNGNELVITALGGTAAAFLGMSGFAMVTKKDFSFMGPFLCAGILVAIVAVVAASIFQLTALALAACAMIALLSSAMILWQTQQIVRGGERNYIMATMTLFASIYNIFVTLLHLLGFGFGEE